VITVGVGAPARERAGDAIEDGPSGSFPRRLAITQIHRKKPVLCSRKNPGGAAHLGPTLKRSGLRSDFTLKRRWLICNSNVTESTQQPQINAGGGGIPRFIGRAGHSPGIDMQPQFRGATLNQISPASLRDRG